MAQVQAQNADWRNELVQPAKDTRVQTEVRWDNIQLAIPTLINILFETNSGYLVSELVVGSGTLKSLIQEQTGISKQAGIFFRNL